MSELGEQLLQAAKCLNGECDHPKVAPDLKTYEPTLKEIKAEYNAYDACYYIHVGNKEIGKIHRTTFQTLFIAKEDTP
jgi:hypothetical protein